MENNDCHTVLITGAASGIGRNIAEAFLQDGSKVHICDLSEQFVSDFLKANPVATATIADVSNSSDVDRIFADFGDLHDDLDTLILNAGIAGPTAAVEEITTNDWEKSLAVNLTGSFYIVRKSVPLLKKRGSGCIVTIASNAGLFGCPYRSPYVATKWAMIGLMKTWAMELGPYNIRVNAVCPTAVEGPRIEGVIARDAEKRNLTKDEIRDVYERQTSMRAFVTADDVSEMVLFLASDRCARISGQAIAVDGNTETLSNWLDN